MWGQDGGGGRNRCTGEWYVNSPLWYQGEKQLGPLGKQLRKGQGEYVLKEALYKFRKQMRVKIWSGGWERGQPGGDVICCEQRWDCYYLIQQTHGRSPAWLDCGIDLQSLSNTARIISHKPMGLPGSQKDTAFFWPPFPFPENESIRQMHRCCFQEELSRAGTDRPPSVCDGLIVFRPQEIRLLLFAGLL